MSGAIRRPRAAVLEPTHSHLAADPAVRAVAASGLITEWIVGILAVLALLQMHRDRSR
jgi:hypothetical protein